MKKIRKSIKKENVHKFINQCKNYLMNFSYRLTIIISKVIKNIDNKLNIYSVLRNKYNISNSSKSQFVYSMVVRNVLDNSIIKLLIVSK